MAYRTEGPVTRRAKLVSAAALVALGVSAGPAAAMPEYRTYDGSGNNLANPTWGAANTALIRLTFPDYGDGEASPAGGGRPSPRAISNAVVAQSASVPSAVGATDMFWQWGQFLDHDIDLTGSASPAEPFNIPVPTGDPHFDPMSSGTQEIGLNRSLHDGGTPRQQTNQITAFIDASNVYGSSAAVADSLRTFSGGKLRTSAGNLLPLESGFFVAGDVRVNEQVGLTAMHTLFMREHNRLADIFAAANPDWDDERLYQEARRVVGAQMQAITYNEFLPMLLGPNALPAYTGYNAGLEPGISNEFSTASFRFGHSMLSSFLSRLDDQGNVIALGNLALRDAFFAPHRIINEGGIEPLLRGLAVTVAQEVDNMVVDDVRNFLFGPPGSGGFDLPSLNIQRGRDHGLPGYNEVRVALGLDAVTGFDDPIFRQGVGALLASVYASIDEVDVWMGGLSEKPLVGALVGELVAAVLADQFLRLRDGDRFWYELIFEDVWLAEINASTLAEIVMRNSDKMVVQSNMFIAPVAEPGSLVPFAAAALAGYAWRRRRALT